MIFAALSEAAGRGELILVPDGLCRWHLRRDGVVVIREILVLPWRWRTGVGRRMVEEVRSKNPGATLLAKCPCEYEANVFWRSLGFAEAGRTEKLIEWRLAPCDSSGAPTATPPTASPPSPPAGSTG